MYIYQMMDRDNIAQIAEGMTPCVEGLTVEIGALPPRPVAQRIVAALARGTSPEWCMSYMVIDQQTSRIVACCNFKGDPQDGSVEIGYGVSPAHWGKGVGTTAASYLIGLAKKSSLVEVVVANISADNHASQRIAFKLGFTNTGKITDSGGEKLMEWALRLAISREKPQIG